MDRGRALVLIGFMGSGKSAAGRAIARRLRVPRFDTDEMVTAEFGVPVAEIFARFGEPAFRDTETRVLGKISETEPAVIVTGGGIVLRDENVRRLRQLGMIIRLTADDETLFARVSRRKTRPLLHTSNPRETIASLLAERERFYAAAADATVDTSRLSHEETADEVIARWNAVAPAEGEAVR